MPAAPTPKKMALKILDIFLSYFKRRPGEVLDLNNIIEVPEP
jgi:hypothetical protein